MVSQAVVKAALSKTLHRAENNKIIDGVYDFHLETKMKKLSASEFSSLIS